MRRFYYILGSVIIIAVIFIAGAWAGFKVTQKGSVHAILLRDIQQITHRSHAIESLNEKDYERAYNIECKSLYAAVANIYVLDEEFPEERIQENKLVASFLESMRDYVSENPQSLAFLESDLFDRDSEGSLTEPHAQYIKEVVTRLQN